MVGFVQRPPHPVLAGGTVMSPAAIASAPALRFSRTRPYANDLMAGAVGADKLHRNRSRPSGEYGRRRSRLACGGPEPCYRFERRLGGEARTCGRRHLDARVRETGNKGQTWGRNRCRSLDRDRVTPIFSAGKRSRDVSNPAKSLLCFGRGHFGCLRRRDDERAVQRCLGHGIFTRAAPSRCSVCVGECRASAG